MKANTPTILVQVLIPQDWHAWVRAEAQRSGTSIAGWLRKLVGEAFDRRGTELDALKGRVARLEDEFARHLTRPVAARTRRNRHAP